jgi:hypothetical protein
MVLNKFASDITVPPAPESTMTSCDGELCILCSCSTVRALCISTVKTTVCTSGHGLICHFKSPSLYSPPPLGGFSGLPRPFGKRPPLCGGLP